MKRSYKIGLASAVGLVISITAGLSTAGHGNADGELPHPPTQVRNPCAALFAPPPPPFLENPRRPAIDCKVTPHNHGPWFDMPPEPPPFDTE